MDCVPDTHALVWFLEDSDRISGKAKDILASPQTQLVVPTIVLAEVEYLYRKRKIGIDLDTVLEELGDVIKCLIYPFDQAVLRRLPQGLEMHDAIIVATGLVNQDLLGRETVIVTQDARIIELSPIKTIW